MVVVFPEVPLTEQLNLVLPRNAFRTFGLVLCGVLLLYPLLGAVTFLTGNILTLLHIPAEPQALALLLRLRALDGKGQDARTRWKETFTRGRS